MSLYKLKSYIPILYKNLKPCDAIIEDFKVPMSEMQLSVLKRLGVLLMETMFTSKVTKVYMQNPGYSLDNVATFMDILSVNTVKSRIRTDTLKYKILYEKDILDTILNTTTPDELDLLDNILVAAINKSQRITHTSQELLTIPIPHADAVYSYEITDDEFEVIKAAASRLSVKQANATLERLGAKGIGYLLYLLDTDPVETLDLKRRKELLERLTV